jgi:predicted transcriptional regulator
MACVFDHKIVEDILLDFTNDQKQKLLRRFTTTDHHMTFNALFWVWDIRIKHVPVILMDYSLIFIILKKQEASLGRRITNEMIIFVGYLKNGIKIFVFREG